MAKHCAIKYLMALLAFTHMNAIDNKYNSVFELTAAQDNVSYKRRVSAVLSAEVGIQKNEMNRA